jgi:histone deacetylase 11
MGWPWSAQQTPPRPGSVLPGGAIVAWSPAYRISFFGIERLHPFDIGKMDRIVAHLVEQGLLQEQDLAVPAPASEEELARVHAPAYLASLHHMPVVSRALEVPVPDIFPESVLEQRVLIPFRTAVGGTALAAEAALQHGLGINLGGGYHHARPALGHGFCLYNDVAHAIHTLRARGFAGPVLIVDTDIHQGDGNHAFFAQDPTVYTFSMHRGDLFPHPKMPGDRDVELPPDLDDTQYLALLQAELEQLLPQVRPELVIHVAGADILSDDPLGGLAMTPQGLLQRDLHVLRTTRARKIPLLHVLAGGYGPSAASAQAQSLEQMLLHTRT